MRVFFSYFRLTIQDYSTYRANFLLWRLRMLLRLVISLAIWKAILAGQTVLSGYDMAGMTSYLVLVHCLGALVFSGRIAALSDQIHSGEFSTLLLRPQRVTGAILGIEIADKVLNLLFVPLEIMIALALTGLTLRWEITLSPLALGLVAGGTVLYFLINTAVSLLAFWTTQVWAVRFFLSIILDFCAGTFIPLELYPQSLGTFLRASPFASVVYLPTQVLMGRQTSVLLLVQTSIWILLCAAVVTLVWRKGVRRYSSDGR